ncbi:MAG: DUF6580 family putative transport protein [Patescibacteria group bacterium]|nr:DUF6580 family putative transport protein [Patescibacteria group bacterium]
MSKKAKLILIIGIITLAAGSRLIKHPFNFTPIIAMSIFAGVYLNKKWAVMLPLAAMIISDFFIGFYDWQVMASVYAGIALAFFIGYILKKRKKWQTAIAGALASSAAFFIITNFSIWAFFDWYPHTWAGLLNCFTLALPFFRNSLAGDLLYTGAFFAAYEVILALVNNKIARKAKAEINA